MHELSVALSILDEVGEVAARQRIKCVLSVRLQVGELSSVVNDALLFSWDLAAAGTVAEGARLDIERIPVEVLCPRCEVSRAPISANHLVCSACGAEAPTITRGRELQLVAMEVADDDSGDRSPTVDPEEELDARARAAP